MTTFVGKNYDGDGLMCILCHDKVRLHRYICLRGLNCVSSVVRGYKGYKGHKDGLQPESLADGNWLVCHDESWYQLKVGKVRLHRCICLWWASERKLGKKPVTKPKTLENQGNRARHLATKEATPKISGWLIKVLKRAGLSSN